MGRSLLILKSNVAYSGFQLGSIKSLQQATKVFKEADEAVGVSQGLWKKLEPIATQLAPWLGTAAIGTTQLSTNSPIAPVL